MREKAYFGFHPSRLAFWKWYLVALILIITGLVFILSVFNIIPFSIPFIKDYAIYISIIPFVGIVFIIIAEMLRRCDTYIITSHRIIEKSGIINIKEDSINWEKISNYSLTQNAVDRIFGIGSIHLWSMGGEIEPEVTIKKTAQILKIRNLLDKLIQRR
jgi:uncharacterized membrane protein YdbT with pleckstrin-like domain